ncbi:MAG: hypothetical protein ACRYFU_17115 [Janthinobacterium lividum]
MFAAVIVPLSKPNLLIGEYRSVAGSVDELQNAWTHDHVIAIVGFLIRGEATASLRKRAKGMNGADFLAHLCSLSYMQRTAFDPQLVTDWMYYENGCLVGGFTTKALNASARPS